MMDPFDVWLRKRAAKKPHLYGPVLAAEGREMGEVVEPPKEPALVRQEVPPALAPQPVRDVKAEVADHDDAGVVEDLEALKQEENSESGDQ